MHETPLTQIAQWREAGADRVDPVRFRLIEALARRSAGHDGEARRLLDARLAQWMDAYGKAVAAHAQRAMAGAPAKPAPGPLAGLVAAMAVRPVSDMSHGVAGAQRDTGPAPALIDYFRDSWAKVNAEGQLRQALDRVPANAGPLNSNHLVHGALALMRDLSPGYFQRFLAYADGLAWLEQMNAGHTPTDKDPRRPSTPAKRTRTRRREPDAPLA